MLDQLALPFAFDGPTVEATREVRYRGDGAFPYTYVPSHPPLTPDEVGGLLELAEGSIRYKLSPSPILVFERNGAGNLGVVGNGEWHLEGARGARAWRRDPVVQVSWLTILRLLRERADAEPGIAKARNHAEAIRLLAYFQDAYLGPQASFSRWHRSDWDPDPFLDRLRDQIVAFGGTVPEDLLVRAADAA
jgi:hypothetical protein